MLNPFSAVIPAPFDAAASSALIIAALVWLKLSKNQSDLLSRAGLASAILATYHSPLHPVVFGID